MTCDALPHGRASALNPLANARGSVRTCFFPSSELVAVAAPHRRGRGRWGRALADLLPLVARERPYRVELLLRQLRVQTRQLFRRPVVEVLHDIGQLAGELVGAPFF